VSSNAPFINVIRDMQEKSS